MTVLRGFAITIASGLIFGCLGAGLGGVIGRAAPDYYRVVFNVPPDIEINSVQMGLWLGTTQGLVAGWVTGLVIVVSVAWYNARTAKPTWSSTLDRADSED